MKRGAAPAKVNLALVVGPSRPDGKHELVTVYQRVALADRLIVERATQLSVDGFPTDTLVRGALTALAEAAGTEPTFAATIQKRIPVAAGLGGGSSDAAAALRLGNALLDDPLPPDRLHDLAAGLGADVPFFLHDGPQLGTGDGTTLAPLELPQDYWVLLVLPNGTLKASTADLYSRFDARNVNGGFESRAADLRQALAGIQRPRDLARLPAERPRLLAAGPRAGGSRCVPGRRHGCRADRLRPLPPRRSRASGAGADGVPGPDLAHDTCVVRLTRWPPASP